jgi:glutathione S-transferase
MGAVPILDVGRACIPQSKAIERFVARKLGLLGIDPFEEALVDAVCELIRDLEKALEADESRHLISLPHPSLYDVACLQRFFCRFISVELPEALLVINRFIARACGGFCVGCSLSLADIKVFQFFNPSIFRQQHDAWHAQLTALLSQNPLVAALIAKVAAVHGIGNWMQALNEKSQH